ncbi:hypothetical protein LPW11_10015 [Geomonas sp. RF6]|uniref:hypothetical protein n=1 Tax=Geomonas sp. RF6 TaxID=2897342 RepID=UPI001E28C4F4|nr:hypothetical protein [Geomonas sp. RF6]UFS72509.1 hypothetical protein LPW11_10015 [Geomonas sp. RF6]
MKSVVVGALLLMVSGCGWKTADEANGKDSGGGSTIFTNNTTITTISGTVTTTVRQAGSFASSSSPSGIAPYTTTTSNGTFSTATQLIASADTIVTFETITDTTASPATEQILRAGGRTVTVNSVVSWVPGLNAGTSITLVSGQTINVPSGTTVATLDGGFQIVTGHHLNIPTTAGAIVSAPVTASGAADNAVKAQ